MTSTAARHLVLLALGLPLIALWGCPPNRRSSPATETSAGDEAITFPDEARASQPERHPAQGAVAEAERILASGDLDRAQVMLVQAVAQAPEDARARLDLGLVLELRNHYEQAEEQYRAALAIDADFAEAASNLGLLLRDRRRLDEALVQLRHAVEVQPSLAEAWTNLALTLEDSDRALAALDAYRHAVRLSPDAAGPRVNMALLLITLDRGDEAAIELRRALSHAQGDAALLLAIGNGLRRVGQAEPAVRALSMAIEA
ncbi:MAG: tetratricopeptide repeat protein, partial [Deltaproteobacteria bacterium]|nr:tetratricopeptide repeat protein [Deltaproteobacteria bacterium]